MPAFRVVTTPTFDRSIKRLARKNPNIAEMFDELIGILSQDAVNAFLVDTRSGS